MKKTKKASVIVIVIIIIIMVVAVLVVARREEKIPYIAFMENHTREECLFICANGDIYASTSEEAFTMDFAEMEEKIQANDYADILKFMGTTDAKKVKKMYKLYTSIVINNEYHVANKKGEQPASQEYGGKVRYWSGIYYNDEGELVTRNIYQSNAGKVCSNKLAYIIVKWMYNCLKEYIE